MVVAGCANLLEKLQPMKLEQNENYTFIEGNVVVGVSCRVDTRSSNARMLQAIMLLEEAIKYLKSRVITPAGRYAIARWGLANRFGMP